MAEAVANTREIPFYVTIVTFFIKSLIRMGISMSPTVLLTVRGRRSGKNYTTPVVMFELDGRAFLFSFFGESNWVRNLRAAGKAAIRNGSKLTDATAVELKPEAATTILRDSLTPLFEERLFGRLIRSEFRVNPGTTLEGWRETADLHPVFEVRESTNNTP
jgi:deazaflavin-dependent oxidoreductase (nitroreductase family)